MQVPRAQRSDLNAARISAANSSGCSHAAKWPPRFGLAEVDQPVAVVDARM